MKKPVAIALFTWLSSFPFTAWAADVPTSAPMPPLPTPTSAATGTSAAAPATTTGLCRLGEHPGVEDADAQTATQLVCVELARAGAPAGANYRVDIGRLGSLLVLTVAREGDTRGSTADVRETKLHGIEEASAAAPRLAAALVHGTAVEEAEAPSPAAYPTDRRNGVNVSKIHFALGLIGQFPPLDRSPTPAPGLNFELHSEIDPFEIVGNFRFGGDSDRNSVGVVFANFSMGGRYFMSDGEATPYIGGGFAWSYFNLNDNVNQQFSGNHTGLGAYGELGLEFLRTHHTHLAVGARLDAPFFSLNGENSSTSFSGNGVPTAAPPPPTLYYAPLSLEVRITF